MTSSRRVLVGLSALLVPAAFAPGCSTDDPGEAPLAVSSSSSGGEAPGAPDEARGLCGNGVLDPGEACDDTNALAGDGCAADCRQVEAGFVCTRAGAACASVCGDGVRIGDELCDDGNARGGDGCSIFCQLEPGFECPTENQACAPVVCGDGVRQGLEQCDDNDEPYDGCFQCRLEPVCTATGCTGVCGDGVIFPGEACDDGNPYDGDGCSSTCQPETGFACENRTEELPAELVLPVVYRDFQSPFPDSEVTYPVGTTPTLDPNGHPDFEQYTGVGVYSDLVGPNLGADGTPVYLKNHGVPSRCSLPDAGNPQCAADLRQLTGPDEFYEWFHSGRVDSSLPSRSQSVVRSLALSRIAGTDTYVFDSNLAPYKEFSFFPLDADNAGWGIQSGRVCRDPYSTPGTVRPVTCVGSRYEPTRAGCTVANPGPTDYACIGPDATVHNFFFTTELHFVFTYSDPGTDTDGPELSFTGDDDVWIFINGRRVVDLGGLHGIMTGSVKLTRAKALELGMTDQGVYDIALFHAERRYNASNFKFTLAGFLKQKTFCEPICGDGIKTRTETCDDGALGGGYGTCAPGCVWGPRCGDGVIQREHGEECDDRNFQGNDGCTPACKAGN